MGSYNEYICELTRQLVHPQEGIEQPQLKTFRQWISFIQGRDAWVNAGIDEKTADVIRNLPFGQVITNTISDYSLFRFGNLGQTIQKKLYSSKKEAQYRIVLNYLSFDKLISFMGNEISHDDYSAWKQTINPRVFWIHFLVSQDKINWLQRNNIGVIVSTQGDQSFFRRQEDGNVLFNRKDGLYHRLLLNGRDLIHLFNMAYMIKNHQKIDRQDEDFFELLGGDDLEVAFMKLNLR